MNIFFNQSGKKIYGLKGQATVWCLEKWYVNERRSVINHLHFNSFLKRTGSLCLCRWGVLLFLLWARLWETLLRGRIILPPSTTTWPWCWLSSSTMAALWSERYYYTYNHSNTNKDKTECTRSLSTKFRNRIKSFGQVHTVAEIVRLYLDLFTNLKEIL